MDHNEQSHGRNFIHAVQSKQRQSYDANPPLESKESERCVDDIILHLIHTWVRKIERS
jgi:hypothetical protein